MVHSACRQGRVEGLGLRVFGVWARPCTVFVAGGGGWCIALADRARFRVWD